jgi:hypothetical protein
MNGLLCAFTGLAAFVSIITAFVSLGYGCLRAEAYMKKDTFIPNDWVLYGLTGLMAWVKAVLAIFACMAIYVLLRSIGCLILHGHA